MSNLAGLLILIAILLGSAAMRYLKTFRQKAVGVALFCLSLGVALGMLYASQLADPTFENRAKVIAFSIAFNAIMAVFAILVVWLAERRRTN